MNYGDYAYIEAFPGGMFSSFPTPNLVRQRADLRDLDSAGRARECPMALRIAVYELDRLVRQRPHARTSSRRTRDYLMKNVYVMTARQDDQLGYALDSRWYGIGEFTGFMRDALRR